MNPLVSILIPVFNKAAFVRDTLDSALAQTYPNTELILVNDGSTDGSLYILESYAARFPERIKLINSPNQGVSGATNLCIQHASGEYFQFLDADDLLSPNKIEAQIRLLHGKGKRALTTCQWWSFRGSLAKSWYFPLGIFSDFDSGLDFLVEMFDRGEMMAISSYLCHRDLIQSAGSWDSTLRINQDGEFFCRVALQADSVWFEPHGKVYYRKPGADNVSQQKSWEAAASQLETYRRYSSQILSKHDSEKTRSVVGKNFLRFAYVFFPNYPDLIEDCFAEFEKLGLGRRVYIGGSKFRTVSKLLGFKSALRLKKWMSSK